MTLVDESHKFDYYNSPLSGDNSKLWLANLVSKGDLLLAMIGLRSAIWIFKRKLLLCCRYQVISMAYRIHAAIVKTFLYRRVTF